MLIENLYPLFSYFLGTIPFGLILSNLFGRGNLRESGSKNIGATNVLRTQGKILGFVTFVLDFAKGFIACHFLQTDNEIINVIVIAAPVFGHIFPIWLKFKGGKGVATYFGVLCALNLYAFIGSIAVWIAVFAIVRISSVAGLASVISSCILFFYIQNSNRLDFINQLYVLMILVAIIIVKHHENIRRLINNNELKT